MQTEDVQYDTVDGVDVKKVYQKVDDVILHEDIYYVPSEKLRSSCDYSEGVKCGHEIVYDDVTGRIIQTQSYFNGVLNGFQFIYDVEGNRIEQNLYQNGIKLN